MAEDASKVDQYMTSDDGRGSEMNSLLHGEPPVETEVFYAFVCRAVLGRAIGTKEEEKRPRR